MKSKHDFKYEDDFKEYLRQYRGEYGTLFRRTDFGYIPESYFNRDLEGKAKPFHKDFA